MHDFDFLLGDWRVSHRKLAARLVGSTDWMEFDGAASTVQVLGGSGNVEDHVISQPTGAYRALGVRSFDPQNGRWSIWWLDGRYPSVVGAPVIGGFSEGVGTFYSDDDVDGRRLRTRFLWTRINTASPRWEQAESADGGATWETNWTMDWVRA